MPAGESATLRRAGYPADRPINFKPRDRSPSMRRAILSVVASTLYGFTSGVEDGRSPAGSDENTGNASAFSDRLIIGCVEVISMNPVKLCSPSRGPTFAAPCANGPRLTVLLPSRAPAELMTVSVTDAVCVVEGFA